MITNKIAEIPQNEIAYLAYLNWEKDGKPQGKDLEYWLEAESELKTILSLSPGEGEPHTNGRTKARQTKPQPMQKPRRLAAAVL